MIIDKPNNYIRDMKGGILENGIKYTVIKDPNINYSSVACCVGVGSAQDPKDFNGLAHFLEHMLFLGSKKYKDADYFNKYITQNGGFSNAYTAFFETNYYYKINNNALEKSLDIFSRFFIDPLFDEKFVNREVNAVHSEHSKNINNDFWLNRQVIFNLSNKDSYINSFSTGNNETLNKKETRDEMIKFFDKYYCSDNMSIAIISNNDIDDNEKIIKNIFGKIKAKKCVNNEINDFPKYSIKNKEYKLEPVNNNEDLTIIYFFDIDYLINYNFDKSIYIISDIINDFNKDGLYYKLKSNGLIHKLSVYINDEGVLMIFIEVNKENGDIKNKISKINSYMKFFLNNLKNLDLVKLYDYHSNKYNINYKYADKEEATEMVQEVCVNMLYHDIKNFYNGDKIVLKKDINKFKDVIDKLNFSNANILYYCKHDLGKFNKEKEKYYNAVYGELEQSYIKDMNLNNLKFNIVDYNKYYDINPKIIKNLDRYNIPSLYDKRKWYGGVSKYNEVTVFGRLIFTNNSLFNTIDNFIITSISIQIINYYMELKFSDANDIGFSPYFSSNSNRSTIVLSINGLNDRYTEFYNEVLKFIPTIKPENDVINNYIISTKDNYENLKTINPWKYFGIILNKMFNKNYYDFNDILKNLNNKNYINDIKKRINTIINFKNLSLYSIFYGNFNKNNIPKNKSLLDNYNLQKINYVNDKKIISGEFKKLNKNDDNNMVVNSFHCCNYNPLFVVKLFILDNLLENEAYTYLRTKEQLGYLVKSQIYYANNNYYLMIKIQSEKDINYIQNKIDEFIKYFKSYFISKMNEKGTLDDIKKTVHSMINTESSSGYSLFLKYYKEIIEERYFFNKEIILSNQLDNISENDMIDFVNKIFSNKEVIIIN